VAPKEATPEKRLVMNQRNRNTIDGTSIIGRKKPMGIRASTLARGNMTKYAPRTPAIAPLAPTVGTVEEGEEKT
jgi:hypothetical protein